MGRGGERRGQGVDDFGGEVDFSFSPGKFFLPCHFTLPLTVVGRQTRRY